jgi:capsid protein
MLMVGAWLEEAVAIGAVEMPPGLTPDQFYLARDALVKGTFVTASSAMIEPARERQAQQMGLAMGVETLDSICAEEGEAWEDNLEQIAREKLYAADLGLSLPGIMPLIDPAMDPAADPDNADPAQEAA